MRPAIVLAMIISFFAVVSCSNVSPDAVELTVDSAVWQGNFLKKIRNTPSDSRTTAAIPH